VAAATQPERSKKYQLFTWKKKMSISQYNRFPSALVDAEYVQMMTDEGRANGCSTPAPEDVRYTLIANCLVPEPFVQFVKEELEDCVFGYGWVLSPEYLFDKAFLKMLDPDQKSVLMPTVLLLASRGQLPLCLWSGEGEAV
jgi:hypothetical protein